MLNVCFHLDLLDGNINHVLTHRRMMDFLGVPFRLMASEITWEERVFGAIAQVIAQLRLVSSNDHVNP